MHSLSAPQGRRGKVRWGGSAWVMRAAIVSAARARDRPSVPHLTYPLRPQGRRGTRSSAPSGSHEQMRWIAAHAHKLLAVERDAEAGQHRDLEAALTVESEWGLGDAVDIGAAADELHQIHIGKRRRELQIGGQPKRGVPAVA